ncbi:actin-binding Rho-activating protein-like [Onthophagus taurus]|uniref:actin-binding Rho-activating protein-like n=1 Tax=Onthophagus taurus TaxID=166361 RepID=UPI000C20EDE8|nr:actin-binding Rho-activating protein-like [Onthophagus taurus]
MSCVERPRVYLTTPLSSKIALFDAQAKDHKDKQSVNPFSNETVHGMNKPQFSKDEYGRPLKGSLSETRGFKATAQVCKEMLELCELIDHYGEPLFKPGEKDNDPRKVISFGDLFTMYTIISDKLVGMLLRARKHKLLDFEGECLFQRRDDHVPIILLKPIQEIRGDFHQKIDTAMLAVKENERRASEERQLYCMSDDDAKSET